jgi:hypothetical protein
MKIGGCSRLNSDLFDFLDAKTSHLFGRSFQGHIKQWIKVKIRLKHLTKIQFTIQLNSIRFGVTCCFVYIGKRKVEQSTVKLIEILLRVNFGYATNCRLSSLRTNLIKKK